MRALITLIPVLLTGCASYGYLHNGQPTTDSEYYRAVAECERRVGGDQFKANLNVCLSDGGWRFGKLP